MTRFGCRLRFSLPWLVSIFRQTVFLVCNWGLPCFAIADWVLRTLLSVFLSFRSSMLLPGAPWGFSSFPARASMVSHDGVLWDILHWFQRIIFRSIPVLSADVASVPAIASMSYKTVYYLF